MRPLVRVVCMCQGEPPLVCRSHGTYWMRPPTRSWSCRSCGKASVANSTFFIAPSGRTTSAMGFRLLVVLQLSRAAIGRFDPVPCLLAESFEFAVVDCVGDVLHAKNVVLRGAEQLPKVM